MGDPLEAQMPPACDHHDGNDGPLPTHPTNSGTGSLGLLVVLDPFLKHKSFLGHPQFSQGKV